MRRLIHVEVNGLLGRFNHSLEFPADWEFLIIHGPNGIGKTRFLELVDAVFSEHPARVVDMRFESALFRFSDGHVLSIRKETREGQLPDLEDASTSSPTIEFVLTTGGDEIATWHVNRREVGKLPPPALREVERTLPVERAGPDMWFDHVVGDYASLAELADRYPEDFPFPEVLYESQAAPEGLQSFLSDFKVHLIETQRLVSLQAQGRGPGHPRERAQRSRVLQYSQDLSNRIRMALAENSRRSQDLDKSFPRRVLFGKLPGGVTDEQIRERYANQLSLRASLAEIDVLDPAADLDLPDRELQDWERRVLWTYLDDAEEKLQTFDYLSTRVQLLKDIVNARFQFKELHIDGTRGFVLRTEFGDEISANVLSSGEQHELVLLYELLFKAEPNSLVLIDEPEISLHVAWQREFLADIQRVASLASLRFVVATHSPQIIDRWGERAYPLLKEDQLAETPAADT